MICEIPTAIEGYGLDGKRCDSMKSGMNIIRMSNGTTRKIVK